jgi:polyvinyl alcohol dehydrogenase (cytochrome)
MAMTSLAWAGPCTDKVNRNAPVLQNGFGADLQNTRNTMSDITAENVGRLKLALTHAASAMKSDGTRFDKRGAPAVTQQAVFFSADLRIIAMNRLTGCTYWTYTAPDQTLSGVGSNSIRSSAVYLLNEGAPKPALIIAGDFFGNVHAIDAVTGKKVWSRFVGTATQHHFITGAPQVADGKLFVPISSKEVLSSVLELGICCTSHGMLQALNPYTGATIWTYHTSPNATYKAATQTMAPNGMSIWGSPAIDSKRRQVYVGTAQNLAPPTTSNSDSIIALNLDTGAQKWVFQATAGDAFNIGCALTPTNIDCKPPAGPDFDFGAPPMLVSVRHCPSAVLAGQTDVVVAGAKNGVVYSLDPANGTLNWSHRLGAGGPLGGIHWGMATDGTKVYVGVSDITVNKASNVPGLGLIVSNKVEPVPDAHPGLYALDVCTGALVWERHPQHLSGGVMYNSIYSAAVSVTNDVLFAGSMDGRIRALATSDGTELWSANTAIAFTGVNGVKGNGGGIDSAGPIAAGSDVLVNTGYASFGGVNAYHAGPGTGLFIYRLPAGPL